MYVDVLLFEFSILFFPMFMLFCISSLCMSVCVSVLFCLLWVFFILFFALLFFDRVLRVCCLLLCFTTSLSWTASRLPWEKQNNVEEAEKCGSNRVEEEGEKQPGRSRMAWKKQTIIEEAE